jgi:hypothetical protein
MMFIVAVRCDGKREKPSLFIAEDNVDGHGIAEAVKGVYDIHVLCSDEPVVVGGRRGKKVIRYLMTGESEK